VQAERLRKTVEKVRGLLARRAAQPMDTTLEQLRQLLASSSAPSASAAQPLLKVIQASVGSTLRLVPVDEVVYIEAADKYLRVVTAEHEVLIRTPLKELLPQLDPSVFWQVHRGTVVRATAIDSVLRDEAGKLSLALKGRPEKLPVSRLYAHLFKAM
jgi:DNA-binding LytR/AlgR family response regulator